MPPKSDLTPPFPRRDVVCPVSRDSRAGPGISLRAAIDSDGPFLRSLYVSFRAEEMARVPWPREQKDAILREQFRLQHYHFVTHFPAADFWIVERSESQGTAVPVGRLYLDRSKPRWHVVDIGLLPDARGRGIGSGLLTWAQSAAAEAGAQGIDLHVLVVNEGAGRLYDRLGFRPHENPESGYQRMRWDAAR